MFLSVNVLIQMPRLYISTIILYQCQGFVQPRSQGLSSSRPPERENERPWERGGWVSSALVTLVIGEWGLPTSNQIPLG